MPLAMADLHALFAYLETHLETEGCDSTFRLTRAFLAYRHLADPDRIVQWLGQYGGFCDCEVIANVQEEWGASSDTQEHA